MEFVHNHKKLVIRGTPKSPIEWLMGKKQVQLMDHAQQAQIMMLCVYPNTGINLCYLEKIKPQEMIPALQTVIDSFRDVFAVPKQLPPPRCHDHRIPLIEGDPPVNIRSYRHPPTQKDAI
ncbi:hypothetical protein Tco_0426150 [Tanacetum coccineum]